VGKLQVAVPALVILALKLIPKDVAAECRAKVAAEANAQNRTS